METHWREADNLKGKSLLFISAKYRTLEGTISFLERRDIKVFHAETIKDAIDVITQRKIDFVFLSVSLDNTVAAKVIPVLTTTFKMTIIAFSEKAERVSRNALTVLNHPHKLHSPMNGPKVVSKLAQIIRNQEANAEKNEDRISIRSGPISEETQTFNSDAEHAAAYKIKFEPSNGLNEDYIVQKGNRGEMREAELEADPLDGTFTDKEDESKDYNAIQASLPTAPSSARSYKPQNKEIGKVVNIGANRKAPPKSAQTSPETSADAQAKRAGGLRKGASSLQHDTSKGGKSNGQRPDTENDSNDLAGRQSEGDVDNAQALRANAEVSAQDSSGPRSDDEILYNSIVKPIKEALRPTKTKSRICALTIRSGKFQGYVVLAMKEDDNVPINIIHLIRQTLIKHLERQGEMVDVENLGFEIDINKMEFSNWAEEFADHLSIGDGRDDEMDLAFISGEDAIPLMEASEVLPDMYAVLIKDIKPNTKLTFDIYIYMPKNSRFVRYGRDGGKLTSEQLERLKAAGIVHFHLLGKHRVEFQAYCGEHYIRAQLIDSKNIISLTKAFKKIS